MNKIKRIGILMMMGVLASGCTKSEPKPDNSIKRHATTQEIKECIDSIHQTSPFKDIDSIKIEDQGDYQPTFIPSSTEGQWMILLYVNAKNSFGAYSGRRMMTCLYRKDQPVFAYVYQ